MYVIRCNYYQGDDCWYDYWSNELGWTFYIELATVFKEKPVTLPVVDTERDGVEVIKLRVDSDSTS